MWGILSETVALVRLEQEDYDVKLDSDYIVRFFIKQNNTANQMKPSPTVTWRGPGCCDFLSCPVPPPV